MSPFEIGLYSLGAIVILVYLGFWVPFALMLSSYVGVWLIKDSSILAGKLLALAASETISSYFFGVVREIGLLPGRAWIFVFGWVREDNE